MMQSFSKKKKKKKKTQIKFNNAMHDHWATDSLRPIREKLCHPYDFKAPSIMFTSGLWGTIETIRPGTGIEVRLR